MNWAGLILGLVGVLVVYLAVQNRVGSFAQALGVAAGTYTPPAQGQSASPNLNNGASSGTRNPLA